MKKVLLIAMTLVLAAAGAWALKGKVDVTTKAPKTVQVLDKMTNAPVVTRTLRNAFKVDPEGAVTLPWANSLDTQEDAGQLSYWDHNGDGSTWGLAQTSDGGYVARCQWNTYNAADDYLFMPPMLLDAAVSYTFGLDARANSTAYPERFEVVLLADISEEGLAAAIPVIPPTVLESSEFSTFQNENVRVAETGYYSFAIHSISDPDMYYLVVDNFFAKANLDKDLGIALNVPATVNAGQTATIEAVVNNSGSNPAQNYTVTINAGDESILNLTVADELAVGASRSFEVEIATTAFDADKEINITAAVEYAGDEVASNNNASSLLKIVGANVLPPTNLVGTGNANGTIALTWEAPAYPDTGGLYTEDFEDPVNFPEFSLGGITASVHTGALGDWTLYDGTGGSETYGYQSIDGPGFGQPMAWLVFAPGSEQLSQDLSESQGAHSGAQALASYCPASSTIASDHWLISPELTGEAQTISLYARALTLQYGNETFQVLASTTDNAAPGSFTMLKNITCDVDAYTEYTCDLPEGTKYFAIRHTSLNIFGLFIDDITFSPAELPEPPAPDAYNIYLDGELVGTVLGDVTNFSIDGLEPGEYEVSVTAVYPVGESAPVTVTVTVPGDVEKNEIVVEIIGSGQVDCATEAVPGDRVAFTVTPDEGWRIDQITVIDVTGTPIDFQPIRAGSSFVFTMPNSTVLITVKFDQLSGVNDVNAGKTVASVRYFNMAGQKVSEANGATIVVTTYTDGTTSTVKMIK